MRSSSFNLARLALCALAISSSVSAYGVADTPTLAVDNFIVIGGSSAIEYGSTDSSSISESKSEYPAYEKPAYVTPSYVTPEATPCAESTVEAKACTVTSVLAPATRSDCCVTVVITVDPPAPTTSVAPIVIVEPSPQILPVITADVTIADEPTPVETTTPCETPEFTPEAVTTQPPVCETVFETPSPVDCTSVVVITRLPKTTPCETETPAEVTPEATPCETTLVEAKEATTPCETPVETTTPCETPTETPAYGAKLAAEADAYGSSTAVEAVANEWSAYSTPDAVAPKDAYSTPDVVAPKNAYSTPDAVAPKNAYGSAYESSVSEASLLTSAESPVHASIASMLVGAFIATLATFVFWA
ncbi:hypothetical protein BC831DRAFT_524969 [Entophlyctis helioformis]|nr:hypothetical protein BC831DRAFT_524969 [Entophlyctis helioformis]